MAESVDSSQGAEKTGDHLFCPYCGTEDKTDYGYCDHCGERVAAPDAVRYSPHELGRCQVCSTENLLPARHCVGCGVALEEKPLRQSGPTPVDSSMRDAVYPDPTAHPPTESSDSETDESVLPPRPSRRYREPSIREQFDRWGRADRDETNRESEAEKRDRYASEGQSESEDPNDSGTREALLPPELKGFNWGACLLGPIWGVGNRAWPATLLFVPWFFPGQLVILGMVLYVGGSIFLGTQANLMAWRAKKWTGIAHFKRAQQSWAFWGFIVSPVILFVLVTLPRATSG